MNSNFRFDMFMKSAEGIGAESNRAEVGIGAVAMDACACLISDCSRMSWKIDLARWLL
jgi:hypothetical protein